MPQVIVPVLAYAAGAVSASTLIVALSVSAASGLYAKHQKRKAEQAARNAYNASLKDRHVMLRGAIEGRDLVLGRVRKSGPLVFFGSTGEHKERFVAIIALAGHEIDGVEQVYFNDEPVVVDGDGWVRTVPYVRSQKRTGSASMFISNGFGSVTLPHTPIAGTAFGIGDLGSDNGSQRFPLTVEGNTVSMSYGNVNSAVHVVYQYNDEQSKARVWWMLGTADQPAHWRVKELFPAEWTDAHRLSGIAYLVVELLYDQDAFPNSIPNISAAIRGAKVHDPRNGTTVWSENPALLARHYAYHPLGANLPAGSVSEVHVIAAANVCDQAVTYSVGGSLQTRSLYTAGTAGKSGTRPLDVLGELAEAMAGKIGFAGNRVLLRAGAYVAPALALDDNDFGDASEVRIQPRRPREQLINTVTGVFSDQANGYQVVDFPRVAFGSYLAEDGRELPTEIELGAITHVGQAQHVCRVLLRDARQALTVTASFKLRAYPVELFDVITLTNRRYGWDAKPFEVISRRWTLEGLIELTLKETDPAIYAFDPNVDALHAAPNTTLPRPWDVPTLGPLRAESGTEWLVRQPDGRFVTRMRVSWPTLTDAAVRNGGRIEVAYIRADQPMSDGQWQVLTVPGDATEVFVTGIDDRLVYVIRARAHNALATGDWSTQVVHRVVGKTAPPSDVPWALVAGNRLTWGPVADLDLAGYRWRYVSGASVNWAAGQPMHEGLLTEASWVMSTRPLGMSTLMVKAVDTSGNESESPAYVITDLGDPVTLNVLESWPQAPTFAGSILGGAVTGGVLEADETSVYWQQGSALHWGSANAAYWSTQSYAALSYECTFTTTAEGTVTLDSEIEGEDVRVQYLREAQTAFWADEGQDFWQADTRRFWPPSPGWLPWPGNVVVQGGEPIGLRVMAAAGLVRGRIVELTPHLDVPDLNERLDDVSIAAGGTRLPIRKAYRVIKNVQLTVQSDGGAGVGARIVDKRVTPGPLIQVLDITNASVPGVVDAFIQGY
ncbi:phage tail protein [Aquabacterium sp. A7-Y]|uniref:phage tail protein n=1 Tax=Aquabacterium sp. A7-Y TaxID=1349605 RepID=UPI00223CB734|nr:phage tail protein [Aquabacterium sp. A7-Y]MCW7541877.1 phage tail protein [Aquabacterium sp. A7-Y]